MATFDDWVYDLVRQVPRGRVITYGAVAALLGDPHKAREVGWALRHCPDDVPAHRVINRFGAISEGPSREGALRRRQRLAAEGVRFDAQGRCDLQVYAWAPGVERSAAQGGQGGHPMDES
jgi:methylated-DNA-protein-cysteine methyltransferase-like protein